MAEAAMTVKVRAWGTTGVTTGLRVDSVVEVVAVKAARAAGGVETSAAAGAEALEVLAAMSVARMAVGSVVPVEGGLTGRLVEAPVADLVEGWAVAEVVRWAEAATVVAGREQVVRMMALTRAVVAVKWAEGRARAAVAGPVCRRTAASIGMRLPHRVEEMEMLGQEAAAEQVEGDEAA
jgi:hypothetical protein